MAAKELPKPAVVMMPSWKVIAMALFLGPSIGFFSAAIGALVKKPFYFSLNLWHIAIGGGVILLGFYHRWAWRPRRKHGRWLRWLGYIAGALYMSALFLAASVTFWNALLGAPWNWIVNGVSIALFILVWLLPAMSEGAAKRIARAQDRLDLKLLAFGSPAALMVTAGIIGANFGRFGGLSGAGEVDPRLVFMAFASPVLAIGAAQYNANHLWPYRPWQKEKDDEPLDGAGRYSGRLDRDVVVAGPRPAPRVGALKEWWRDRRARNALVKGTRLAMQGKYQAAIALLSKAIAADPLQADAFLHRGIAYLESGQVEQALRDFDEAIHLDPGQSLGYYNRALGWLQQGDEGRALADLSEAIRLDPEDAESYHWRGMVYSQRGEHERALADVQKVIELGEARRGYTKRALILEKMGDLAEAAASWSKVLELEPGNAQALCSRGLVLEEMGEGEKARADLKRGLKRKGQLQEELRKRAEEALARLKL